MKPKAWNPFEQLDDLQAKLSTLAIRQQEKKKSFSVNTEWTPLADVAEAEEEYVIKVELPEVEKEDIKLGVDDGVLAIKGERKFDEKEISRKFHRLERSYGSFFRTFTLPDDADAASASAEFKNGVLQLRLPKTNRAKVKELKIRIS